jgi:hypothetical protein
MMIHIRYPSSLRHINDVHDVKPIHLPSDSFLTLLNPLLDLVMSLLIREAEQPSQKPPASWLRISR